MQSLRMGVAWLLSPTIRRDGQVEISRRLPGCQSASQCPAQRRCRSVLHVAAGLDGGRNFCRIWTRCRDNRFPFTDGSTHRDRTRLARASVLNRGFELFGFSPSWRRFGRRGSRTRSFTTASATATGCVPSGSSDSRCPFLPPCLGWLESPLAAPVPHCQALPFSSPIQYLLGAPKQTTAGDVERRRQRWCRGASPVIGDRESPDAGSQG